MTNWLPVQAYPSLASVLAETQSKDASAETDITYAISSDPNLVDMECRFAPLIEVRPSGGEVVGPIVTTTTTEKMVSLKTYRPEITERDKLRVDGIDYDVLKVEHDGSMAYTRLRIMRRVQ